MEARDEYHVDRWLALFDLKRYPEAIDACLAHLAADPDDAVAYSVMAAALVNIGATRDAAVAVLRALELDPNLAHAHYVLSFVHQQCANLSRAEKAIAEAVRLEQSPGMFHQWASIASQRGKFPEALAATEHALRLFPSHTPSLLLRAKLLAAAGNLSEAHRFYGLALAASPEDPTAHHAMGTFRLQAGDAPAALDLLREARRLDPINANDSAAIALAYGRMIWPLNVADRMIVRWNELAPVRCWTLFALLAIALVVGGRLAGSSLLLMSPPPLWTLVGVATASYLALPFSFRMLATAVGRIALRAEFGRRWTMLILNPLVLIPIAGIQVGAAVVGALAAVPALAAIFCFAGANSPLVTESIKSGAGRLTGYVCIPLYGLQIVIYALVATIVDLSTASNLGPGDRELAAIATLLLPALFALSFLNLYIPGWLSWWRARRHPFMATVE